MGADEITGTKAAGRGTPEREEEEEQPGRKTLNIREML